MVCGTMQTSKDLDMWVLEMAGSAGSGAAIVCHFVTTMGLPPCCHFVAAMALPYCNSNGFAIL